MTDNVLMFPGTETIEVSTSMGPRLEIERILTSAAEHDLQDVVVVGTTRDGATYFASSSGDPRSVLWDLQKAEHVLMNSYFAGMFRFGPEDFEDEDFPEGEE